MAEHNCVIFNWKVRGLNNEARRTVVRDMVAENRESIVTLQETKLSMVDRQVILETLGDRFTVTLPAV
jgi:exonuclease III